MSSRWLRLAFGLVVIAVGAFVVFGEQFSGTSADAVVNAQMVTLRAPIDGQLDLRVRALGARVDLNENVAIVTDPRPDETRLLDLQRTADQLGIELQRLKERAAALQNARTTFQTQLQAYQNGRVRQIEARIAEATRSVQGAEAKLREGDATYRRSAELGRLGFQSQAELTRSRSGFEVMAQDVQAAHDRIRFLTVELEAAKGGIFLSDANNDAPHSQQRIQDIGMQLAELSAETEERSRRLDSVNRQIDEEKLRLARFTVARINTPAPGILWDIVAGVGEYVRKGQDVIRLVDCTSAVVTASVRESVYNRLKLGNAAQFRLLGVGRTYDGSVTRLAGSGAQSIYRSLAIGPSEEHLKRFDVLLVFPELNKDSQLACAVGRTGRVIFSAGPLQFWRDWLAELGLI